MTTLEIISFAIAALIGVVATGILIIVALWIARFIERIFFSTSRKELREKSQIHLKWWENERKKVFDYKEQVQGLVDTVIAKDSKINALERDNKHLKNRATASSEELHKIQKELEKEKKNLNPKKLSPKYNPRVTRGSDGRYKSLKSN